MLRVKNLVLNKIIIGIQLLIIIFTGVSAGQQIYEGRATTHMWDAINLFAFFAMAVMVLSVFNFCGLNFFLLQKRSPNGAYTRKLNRYFVRSWFFYLAGLIITGVMLYINIYVYIIVIKYIAFPIPSGPFLQAVVMSLILFITEICLLFFSVKLRKVIRENNNNRYLASINSFGETV